jgi:hypothetical protein
MKQAFWGAKFLITGCILSILAITGVSCTQEAQESTVSAKTLTVQKLGFSLDANQYIKPGEVVKVFAKANLASGASYAWNVPGSFTDKGNGLIEWTVPAEAGDYTISVVATDSSGNASVSRSMSVKVGDGHGYAMPDAYSYTLNTTSSLDNKFNRDLSKTTTTKLSKNADGSITSEISMDNGECQKLENVDGKTYVVAPDGSRSLFAEVSLDDYSANTPSLSLGSLRNAYADYSQNGDVYTFTRIVSGVKSTIVYDDSSGYVTSMKSDDENSGTVSDVNITYTVVDGYVFPEKLTADVSYQVGETTSVVHIIQDFSDITVNATE